MRAVHTTILVLLALAAASCENGPPWAETGAPETEEVAPDFGPTAAYDRRLVFLGAGDTLPTAAVFDFVTLSDSIGIRRGARARVLDGGRWRALMDDGWEMAPMREPWRLVPHGPLTLLVTGAGDLGSLLLRDSVPTRLQLGATLAEHSPDVGTQLVLRSARLLLDDDSVPGILLDAQLGRTVHPASAARGPRPPVGRGATRSEAGTVAGAGADTAPTDTGAERAGREPAGPDTTAGAAATPIARPGTEALLLDNAGFYAVLAGASGGALAWIRSAGRDDVRTGARLEPTAWSDPGEPGVRVPIAWRIADPAGELTGELMARSTDRIVLDRTSGVGALSYALVTGWIEDRQARRDVFGLVRHVR